MTIAHFFENMERKDAALLGNQHVFVPTKSRKSINQIKAEFAETQPKRKVPGCENSSAYRIGVTSGLKKEVTL